jgi:hypothetical protein
MSDEKSIVEKVSDAVKGIVDIASAAAMKALEPAVAEEVHPPEATVPVTPEPLVTTQITRQDNPPDMSGRITPTYDFPAPKSKMPSKVKTAKKTAKKGFKKTAKKSAKKNAAKKWKSPAKAPAKKKKTIGKKAVKKKKAKRG